MAISLMFFESEKWEGRGEALFDSKIESLDWLDEDISQFAESIRDAKTQGNHFDNKYIAMGADRSE